jgi:DNA-binding MarR family transcriptional regulator
MLSVWRRLSWTDRTGVVALLTPRLSESSIDHGLHEKENLVVRSPQKLQRSRKTPASAPLGEAEYRALGHFRKAIRDFLAFSEASAHDLGLTSQQHQALLAIRSHAGPESMTVGELAECLLIKNHTAVELVGRLVERGLALRRESEMDRRRVLLQLTDQGAGQLEAICRRNLHQLHETAEILSDLLATARLLQDAEAAAVRGSSGKGKSGDAAK